MLHFSEELKELIKEADKYFPEKGYGYNYDEWESVEEWRDWITKKIEEEKEKIQTTN